MVRWLGRQALSIISGFGDFALFAGRSVAASWKSRRLPSRVAHAIYEQGALCLPVILIVAIFTGLVLGLQGYYVLNRFGSEGLLGALVSLSLVREMAPVLAALMLVGQAGSALAAEIGIQRNSEQIVALDTMGVNSVGYIVTPRLLSAVVVFPLQTALFVVVGLWGGALSGSLLLGVDSGFTGPRWNAPSSLKTSVSASLRPRPSDSSPFASAPSTASTPTASAGRPEPARSAPPRPAQSFIPVFLSSRRTM